jgi:hypothetical protein
MKKDINTFTNDLELKDNLFWSRVRQSFEEGFIPSAERFDVRISIGEKTYKVSFTITSKDHLNILIRPR